MPPQGREQVETLLSSKSAGLPQPISLQGRFGCLQKLNAEQHGADLWNAVGRHDEVWSHTPAGPFDDEVSFRSWLANPGEKTVCNKGDEPSCDDPFCYVIVDRHTELPIGLTALMEIRPKMRAIEVGYVVYGVPLRRQPLGTEAQFLLAQYVFEVLGYRRYEWKCDARNKASCEAAVRYGFTYEGIAHQHMIVKRRNRDTVWFSMLDSEWPTCKETFQRWLDPTNFEEEGGCQRTSLRIIGGAQARYQPRGSRWPPESP